MGEADYIGDDIEICEWPGPVCEITHVSDFSIGAITIRTKKDAEALIESLQRFLEFIDEGIAPWPVEIDEN